MIKKESTCLRWGVITESKAIENEIHKEFGDVYGEGSSFEVKEGLVDGSTARVLVLNSIFIDYLSSIEKLRPKFRVCVSSNNGVSWRIWNGYREGKKDDE